MHKPMRTTRRPQDLQSRPGWYRITNTAAGPAQVTIYDEIGMLGVSADLFLRDLAAVTGDIEVHLNSPGGDVFDGISIYNQLRNRAGTVGVVVDGLAASAASFIAQAASPGMLEMSPHSQMMIHDGFIMAIGNADDMRKTADLLDKASDSIAGIYADRTGKPAAYWRDQMRNESWYSDQEAVDCGLADKIRGQDSPRNAWDLSVYEHAPAVVNADGNHAPMTGNHAHHHPAFGADGHLPHDHAHDGDANHDHQHTPEDLGQEPDGDGADGMSNALRHAGVLNEKYNADDRKRMAGNGQAMPDGSYPIADEEDLHNAIHAVGRGGADHDAIRRHVIKRAKALGASDAIPDSWNADGSMGGSAGNLSDAEIWAALADPALFQLDAGKE